MSCVLYPLYIPIDVLRLFRTWPLHLGETQITACRRASSSIYEACNGVKELLSQRDACLFLLQAGAKSTGFKYCHGHPLTIADNLTHFLACEEKHGEHGL